MRKYVLVFSVAYLAIIVVVSILFTLFDIHYGGLSVPVLMSASYLAGRLFVEDYKRVPTQKEKRAYAGWSLVSVWIISIALISMIFLSIGPELKGLISLFNSPFYAVILMVGFALTSLIIYMVIGWSFALYGKNTYSQCDNIGDLIQEKNIGSKQIASKPKYVCFIHTHQAATKRCPSCRKPVCDMCIEPLLGHTICSKCRMRKRLRIVLPVVAVVILFGAARWVASNMDPVPKVLSFLIPSDEKLSANDCNRSSILERCANLNNTGKFKSCLNLSSRFIQQCGDYDQLHLHRNRAARQLSKWDIATASADILVKNFPYNVDVLYIKANTLKDQGKLKAAADVYEQIIAIDPQTVVPFDLTSVYKQLNTPCAALPALNQYILHNENTALAYTMVNQLMQDPQCQATKGKGTVTLYFGSDVMLTEAVLNHKVAGKFVIDTGASDVMITKAIADQLKLNYHEWPSHLVRTANGIVSVRSGYLDHVAIQSVQASHVRVSVGDDLGGAADGLLGLSFLSQFKMSLDSQQQTITLSQF